MVRWEWGSYGPEHTEPKSRGWQTGHDSQDTENSSMESHLEEPYKWVLGAGVGSNGSSLLTTKITFELSIPRQRIPQVQPSAVHSVIHQKSMSWDHWYRHSLVPQTETFSSISPVTWRWTAQRDSVTKTSPPHTLYWHLYSACHCTWKLSIYPSTIIQCWQIQTMPSHFNITCSLL